MKKFLSGSSGRVIVFLFFCAILVVAYQALAVNRQRQAGDPILSTAPFSKITVVSTSTYYLAPPRTKFSNCMAANGLPDVACSPGAVFTDVSTTEICVSGYSKSVRNLPEKEWNQVFAEYGVTSHPTGAYEVDHLISLELGGSNDIANLWPEPASPTPGFHEKDRVENYLHKQVCDGLMTLADAQRIIATDWFSVYRKYLAR